MRYVFLAFGLTGLITGLAGCGGSEPAPLSSTQKAQLKETLASTFRALQAPQQAKGLSALRSPLALFAFGWSRTKATSTSSSFALQGMAQNLADSKCDIQGGEPSDLSPTRNLAALPPIHLSVKGDTCPVSLDMSFTTGAQSGGAQATLSADYSVKPGVAYRELNDVVGMKLSGNLAVKMDPGGKSGTAALNAGGVIHSQKDGDIVTTIVGNANGGQMGGTGAIALTFRYPDHTAELKASLSGNGLMPATQFTVNGESVSKEEFASYFEGASSSSEISVPGNPYALPGMTAEN